MLRPDFTSAFAKDRKRCAKKHWDVAALDLAIELVSGSDEVRLDARYNDHALVADLAGCRALHIGGRRSDWLVVYQVVGDRVFFLRTGTHDELFK
jgi:mRNA interferase YafQ